MDQATLDLGSYRHMKRRILQQYHAHCSDFDHDSWKRYLARAFNLSIVALVYMRMDHDYVTP